MGKKNYVQEAYNTALNNYLDSHLLAAADELAVILSTQFGTQSSNTRKIIQRAVESKAIESSKPYKFGKGSYVYLPLRTQIDLKKLKEICKERRPPLFRLISYLEKVECISYFEAQKILGSTHEKSSTKVSSVEDMLNILFKLNFAYKKKDGKDNVFIFFKRPYKKETEQHGKFDSQQEELLMQQEYLRMDVECRMMPSVLRWISASNLIDYNSTRFRSFTNPLKGKLHNNLIWDAFSYTQVTGITNKGVASDNELRGKQTLVAVDLVISKLYTQFHLDGFISRIQINLNASSNGLRKLLPIIVYDHIEDEALNKARAFGCITYDVNALFGNRFPEIFNVLQRINQPSYGDAIDDIENGLEKIFVSGNDDRLKDVKGYLFEYLMYPVVERLFPQAKITMGRHIEVKENDIKVSREFDFIVELSNPEQIILVEVKGYGKQATIAAGNNTTKNTLRYFFRGSVSLAKNYYKGIGLNHPITAIFIASCQFDKEGYHMLEQINKGTLKPKGANVGYDRKALLLLLEEYHFNRQKNIIEKYF